MVLADAEDIESNLIGNGCLLDQMAKVDTGIHHRAGGGIWGEFTEMVDAQFESHVVSLYLFVGVIERCSACASHAPL
jgi:hypothetical protein